MLFSTKAINNINSSKCLLSFLLKYFFKSKIGPIMSIVFPLMFMVVYYIINVSKKADFDDLSSKGWFYFTSGLPAYLVLSIIPLTFVTLPQVMVELKNSILLRKIKTSGFSKYEYILMLFLLYFLFATCSCLMTFIIFLCFLNTNIEEIFHIQYGNLVYALLMLIISSLALGIMVGSLMKNILTTQFVGVAILIVSMMLGGLFMPINILGDVFAMRIIALFSPITYATGLIQNTLFVFSENSIKEKFQMFSPGETLNATTLGYNIFDLEHDFIFLELKKKIGESKDISSPLLNLDISMNLEKKSIYLIWQKVLNLVMPYVVTPSMLFIAFKKFSWYGR